MLEGEKWSENEYKTAESKQYIEGEQLRKPNQDLRLENTGGRFQLNITVKTIQQGKSLP